MVPSNLVSELVHDCRKRLPELQVELGLSTNRIVVKYHAIASNLEWTLDVLLPSRQQSCGLVERAPLHDHSQLGVDWADHSGDQRARLYRIARVDATTHAVSKPT
jgi:hypothetical protein